MIKRESKARELVEVALDVQERLAVSIPSVEDCSDEAEALYYKRAIAGVLAAILVDILNPIFEDYPHLKPPEIEHRT